MSNVPKSPFEMRKLEPEPESPFLDEEAYDLPAYRGARDNRWPEPEFLSETPFAEAFALDREQDLARDEEGVEDEAESQGLEESVGEPWRETVEFQVGSASPNSARVRSEVASAAVQERTNWWPNKRVQKEDNDERFGDLVAYWLAIRCDSDALKGLQAAARKVDRSVYRPLFEHADLREAVKQHAEAEKKVNELIKKSYENDRIEKGLAAAEKRRNIGKSKVNTIIKKIDNEILDSIVAKITTLKTLKGCVKDALRTACRSRADTEAWSGAFVVSCVRAAAIELGLLGKNRLLTATGRHATYVVAAWRRKRGKAKEGYCAFEPESREVQVGDIICTDRKDFIRSRKTLSDLANLEKERKGHVLHCDIVTRIVTGIGYKYAEAIGGNVGQTVRGRRYPLESDGTLVVRNDRLFVQEGDDGSFAADFLQHIRHHVLGARQNYLHVTSTGRIIALLTLECKGQVSMERLAEVSPFADDVETRRSSVVGDQLEEDEEPDGLEGEGEGDRPAEEVSDYRWPEPEVGLEAPFASAWAVPTPQELSPAAGEEEEAITEVEDLEELGADREEFTNSEDDDYRQEELEKEAASSNHSFRECAEKEKQAITSAAAAALKAVNHAEAVVGSGYGRPDKISKNSRALLMRHFHTTRRKDLNSILVHFIRIRKAFEKGIRFECEKRCDPPKPGHGPVCGHALATQLFGGFGNVHVCFDIRANHCDFLKLPLRDREALLIHEVAHRYVGVNDKAYYDVYEKAYYDVYEKKYIQLSSRDAIDNADSYAYFAVELLGQSTREIGESEWTYEGEEELEDIDDAEISDDEFEHEEREDFLEASDEGVEPEFSEYDRHRGVGTEYGEEEENDDLEVRELDPALADLAEKIFAREAPFVERRVAPRWTLCFSAGDVSKAIAAYKDNAAAARLNTIDRCSCIVMLNVALGQLMSLRLKPHPARTRSSRSVQMADLTTKSIEKAMQQLRRRGFAVSPWETSFFDRRNRTAGTLKPERLKASVRDKVLAATQTEGCWFAFALSVLDGYHSVLLLVDRTTTNAKIYWLDQFRDGLDLDVTNSLDQWLTDKTRDYWKGVMDEKGKGYKTTIRLWKLRKRR